MSQRKQNIELPISLSDEPKTAVGMVQKLMGCIFNAKDSEVNEVVVDKKKVKIIRITSKDPGEADDIIQMLSKNGFKSGIPTTEQGAEKKIEKQNEDSKQNPKEVIQCLVLKLDCDGDLSDEQRQAAMGPFVKTRSIEFISIEDSNKVMTIRGKANAMVTGLLKLNEISDMISFTVLTVSPPPKPKPEDKTPKEAAAAKDGAEKGNDKTKPAILLQKTEISSKSGTEILAIAMHIIGKGFPGVHTLSIEKSQKGYRLIVQLKTMVDVKTTLKKLKGPVDIIIESTTSIEIKPAVKVQSKDEKKIVLLQFVEGDQSEIRKATKSVATGVGGLETISIEPPEKKLLTLIGSANVMDVLGTVVKKSPDLVFVSVGPCKKEEPKKKEGGVEDKKNNQTQNNPPPYDCYSTHDPNYYSEQRHYKYPYNHHPNYHHQRYPYDYHNQNSQPSDEDGWDWWAKWCSIL